MDQKDHLFPSFPALVQMTQEGASFAPLASLQGTNCWWFDHLWSIENQYICIIHLLYAKLSLEIRNSNNYRRLPRISPFPVLFRRFSVHIFWVRCCVGFCSPFQSRQTHAKAEICKSCSEAGKHAASNNSWKGNVTYIGRCRYSFLGM